MQARHHRFGLGHRGDDVVGECGRMGAGETHPLQSFDAAHGAQEAREGAPFAEAHAVGVHVLAEEAHFDGSLGDDRLDLGEDLPGAAIAFTTAKMRNDAEGAGVVAADRDRDPCRVGALAVRGQSRGEHLEGLLDLDRRLAIVLSAFEQGGQDIDVVRPEDRIDPGGLLDDALTHLLGEASADGDLHPRTLAFDGGELAEVPEESRRGVLTDRASVDHHDVGALVARVRGPSGQFGYSGDRHEAGLFEQARHSFGIVLVHLASEGADGVGARHPGGAQVVDLFGVHREQSSRPSRDLPI